MGKQDNSKIVEDLGLPDAADKANIQRLINEFNSLDVYCEIHQYAHKNPNKCYVKHAIWETYESGLVDDKVGDFNLKSKDLDMRFIATMHPVFAKELEKGYPGIFRYKEHTIWFAKNFPDFRVARRI
jgi:hypothetical protein